MFTTISTIWDGVPRYVRDDAPIDLSSDGNTRSVILTERLFTVLLHKTDEGIRIELEHGFLCPSHGKVRKDQGLWMAPGDPTLWHCKAVEGGWQLLIKDTDGNRLFFGLTEDGYPTLTEMPVTWSIPALAPPLAPLREATLVRLQAENERLQAEIERLQAEMERLQAVILHAKNVLRAYPHTH